MCSAATENSEFLPLSETAPKVLIIGCGYLGRELAERYLAAGCAVTATTRSGRIAPGLTPRVAARALDLCDPASIERMGEALGDAPLDVVHVLVPPGPEPRGVLLEAPVRLLGLAPLAAARCIVVASSTAVYGDVAGEWVSADTPAAALDGRGRLMRAGEAVWLEHPAVRVLRLAGLYGPGRLIGEADLRRNAPLAGDPERWLNLIHVVDAASLLVAMAAAPGGGGAQGPSTPSAAPEPSLERAPPALERAGGRGVDRLRDGEPDRTPARVELGCDDTPVRRRDWYAGLAAALGLPPPVFDGITREDGPRAARAASRRCDNRPTCRRTGWRPQHPDWRSGLAASLGANFGANLGD